MKDHARHLTDAELTSEIAQIKYEIEHGIVSSEEKERDTYFTDPANAAKIQEQQARMDLIIAMHNARKAAGLTQKQVAEKLGITQASIAELERGRRNITHSTLIRYARACGKKVAITFL